MKQIPESVFRAELTPDNWQEKLAQISLEAAIGTAKELGQENCIHLAVATLQHYYMHSYAQSLPFITGKEKHKHFLEALALVLRDIGLDLEISTVCKEIRKP